MYVGGIDKWFKRYNRIITVILNFRQSFENREHFIVLKSHFGADFQETFFPCGAIQNDVNIALLDILNYI